MHEPNCYAVRRVNPFAGVLQVVEVEGGRAYSPDGATWQIQVVAERPSHTWRSVNTGAASSQFFNFGLWDAARGLRGIPANPLMDIGTMTAEAERVIAALAPLHDRLPFRLIDRLECWAIDEDDRPVVLLATTESEVLVDKIRPRPWQATGPKDERFVAPCLLDRGIATYDHHGNRHHADRLEASVLQRTRGQCWFRRSPDGTGETLSDGGASQVLPKSTFPRLGLQQVWNDAATELLVADYLAWLAPTLLLLQDLSDDERARLEVQACQRALVLDAYSRLLPRIIDAKRIEAAQVEARLRRVEPERLRTGKGTD